MTAVPGGVRMPRVLVTDAGRGSAIAVIRSLGRLGYEVVAADSDVHSPGFRSRHAAARLRYPDPLVDPAGTAERIDRAVRARHVDLVVPVTDDVILPLRSIRAGLERVTRLALPPDALLDLAADKDRTRLLAADLGIPVPRSVVVNDPDEAEPAARDLGWPVVVKPLRSRSLGPTGGVQAHAVAYAADDRELAALLERMGLPLLLQEHWPGHGVGVELLLRDGVALAAFQHQRLREVPPGGGASSLREGVALDPGLAMHAVRLLGEMGWTGVAMAEFRVGPRGPVLLEVNGRIWGSLPLAVQAGVDFPGGLAALALGRDHPLLDTRGHGAVPATRYRTGVRSRHLPLEISWIGNVLAQRGGGPSGPPPRSRALVVAARLAWPADGYDVLSRDDPRPGAAEVAGIARSVLAKAGGGLTATARRGVIANVRGSAASKAAGTAGGRVLEAAAGAVDAAAVRDTVRDSIRGAAGRLARTGTAARLAGLADAPGIGTQGSLAVLTYHRIDDPARDPTLEPSLVSATPDAFRAQVETVARTQHPVSAAEVVEAHRTGRPLPARAVLVTLDDATADVETAWPILRAAGVPALLFVPTGYPDAGRPFWWDRLHATLRARAEARGGPPVETPLGRLRLDGPASVGPAAARLRAWVKSVPHDEAMAWLDRAWDAAGRPPVTANALSWAAIAALAADGLEVAPHTHTHPLLTRVAAAAATAEIGRSRAELRARIPAALDAVFAYPSGAWDEGAVAAAEATGVGLAFTTERGVNRVGCSPALALRRVNVGRRASPGLLVGQLALWRAVAGRAAGEARGGRGRHL